MKMGERMDFFFFFGHLENINGGQKREKIHSTVESTKQQTGRIGPIFFPLVSFLILSSINKIYHFRKTKACTYQDISTASKSLPLKAPSSFAVMKFCDNLFIPSSSVIVSNGFFILPL